MAKAQKKRDQALTIAELDALSRKVLSVRELDAVAEIALASLGAPDKPLPPLPDHRLIGLPAR